MNKHQKKLFWIDYTTSGRKLAGGPWAGPYPFEHVGFEVEVRYWEHSESPENINAYSSRVFTSIENWKPDIVAIMFDGNWAIQESTDEPLDLIQLCARIRETASLKSTKIMAFFRMKDITHQQKAEWEKRYDYYSLLPLKIIEHARIAKGLVGEELSNTEGVTRYLSGNGEWEIFDQSAYHVASGVWVGAKGQFNKIPRTRLIESVSKSQYAWVKDGIKANKFTVIAYLIKNAHDWQEGLTQPELANLMNIRNREGTDCQMLLGVDSSFLETEPEKVIQIVNQIHQNGGWYIFLIDHLWAENKWLSFFDNLFYEKDRLKQGTIEYLEKINL